MSTPLKEDPQQRLGRTGPLDLAEEEKRNALRHADKVAADARAMQPGVLQRGLDTALSVPVAVGMSLLTNASLGVSRARLLPALDRSVYVAPTKPEARSFVTPLIGFDVTFLLMMDVPVCWAWNERLDGDTVQQGLVRVLNDYPSAAGRLTSMDGNLCISCTDSPGVVFDVRDYGSRRRLPKETQPASAFSEFIEEPVIPSEPWGKPLLRARLSLFADGSILACAFSHTLFDGASIASFMNSWSFHCNHINQSPSGLPAKQPPTPVCKHGIELNPDDLKDFELRSGDTLSFAQMATLMTKVPLANALEKSVDLVFTEAEVNRLKTEASQALGKGQWVSSYEVLMSLCLKAMAEARDDSYLSGRAMVNLRERSRFFPDKGYFGDAISVHDFGRGILASMPLGETAWCLHESLRNALKDPKVMERDVIIPELLKGARSRLGKFDLLKRNRFLTMGEQIFSNELPTINSWLGYNWTELSFGNSRGSPVKFMRVLPTFCFHRQAHISPRNSSEHQLRVLLPREEVVKFKLALRRNGLKFVDATHGLPASKL